MHNNLLKTQGLRHLALNVYSLEETVHFYQEVVGMEIEWQPDSDNVYLTSGHDNLALHRAHKLPERQGQRLDHLGFILPTQAAVDDWHEHVKKHGIVIVKAPKVHRDGAKSFYCKDPDGNLVQFVYHPPLMRQ